MKNALKIFKRDLKKIFTNSMAIVLVVGILALPSLYAWFNIYANWDPYGKTGNMMVAVSNCDEGTELKGIKIDIGAQIESNLRGNDAIDWQFVSKQEAVNGVEAGEYYAAIEIPSGFSKNLASIVTPNYTQPQIIYYSNEKKNAIATKITDKVVETVQTEVNESFTSTVVDVINEVLGNVIVVDGDEIGGFEYLKKEISGARDTIGALQNALDSFSDIMEVTKDLNLSLKDKDISQSLSDCDKMLSETTNAVKSTQTAVTSMMSGVGNLLSGTSKSLQNISVTLDRISKKDYSSVSGMITQSAADLKNLKTEVDEIANFLEKINAALPEKNQDIVSVVKSLKNISTSLDNISKTLGSVSVGNYQKNLAAASVSLKGIASDLSEIQVQYKKEIKPALTSAVSSLLVILDDLSNVVDSLQKDAPSIDSAVSTLKKSVAAGDDMVKSMSKILGNTDKKLADLSRGIDSLSKSEVVNTVVNITSENAGELGSFLACPVKVKTESVYGIENYGSAMAPFYSTLAIWVGAMFLVAVVKINVKKRKEISPKLKNPDMYFGRGFLFVSMALIQSLIICIGDLYFLNIQCYHPLKFIFAGLVAGLVFSTFIYSLVYSFGELGKAVGVILLVIQIGGSGGTFPIDVTQDFFVAVNPYLPFTFVIEAMRECICGTYQGDYWIYLLKLMIYFVLALIIGIPLKALVKNPIRFFEKKVEETDIF